MTQKSVPKSRHSDIIVQELDGEIIVYDLKTNKACCLNKTSALVWRLCDGKTDVQEIKHAVGKHFNALVREDLIWLALEQLKEQNLLSDQTNFASKFDGVSRRELIRRIGLGSVVALPFIAALIAPKAISALSVACSGSCKCSERNTVNLTTGVNCRTLGGTSDCISSLTCDCLVTASSKNGTCVGT